MSQRVALSWGVVLPTMRMRRLRRPITRKSVSMGKCACRVRPGSPGIFFSALLFALSLEARVDGQVEARPEATKRITLSYSAVSMTWFPVKVAVEKGFFREEGLEPQLVQMRGNIATAALASGHIDFSLNISPVLNGAMQGLGLKLVAVLNSRPLFSLMVRPELQSPADLKGKVFAVSSFGNTQAILTEKHLQHLGLKKGEYQLIALGATPERVAAMERNLAQGSLMPPPANVQLENRGYRLMGNTAEIVAHPIAGLGTREDKMKKEPELVKKVIRAALRGLQLLQGDSGEPVKILMHWARLSERDALRVYDLSKVGFSKNGFASDEDLSVEWEFLQKETKKSQVPISVARDFRLLDDARRELGIR